jgi:hypothetical protein
MLDLYPHSNQCGFTKVDFRFAMTSVADPGCLFLIPDPDFYPSRIPDLGSKNSNKREGWKKTCYHTFFVVTNFTKLNIILFLKC